MVCIFHGKYTEKNDIPCPCVLIFSLMLGKWRAGGVDRRHRKRSRLRVGTVSFFEMFQRFVFM